MSTMNGHSLTSTTYFRRDDELHRRQRHKSQERSKKVFDWRPTLISVAKKSGPFLWRAVDESREMLRRLMWKHYFTPIDTSNALTWLNIPANLILPTKPVINQLPDELLVRIFSFVVHSDCRTPQDRHTKEIRCAIRSGSSPTTPLTLGHVCSVWREVVNTSPVLWSTIVVCSPEEKHVAMAIYWLERAKSSPLDVTIEQYVSPNPICDAIAHLLVAQAHRWKRLSLILVDEAPFIRLQPGDVPLLEDFRIRLENWSSARYEKFLQVLHSSPALKSINWGRSFPHTVPVETPWSNLVEVTFYDFALTERLFDALSECGSLKTLQLRHMYGTYTPESPLVLDRLERLVCECHERGSAMFNSLTLPSLNEMEVTNFYKLPWEMEELELYPSIISMIQRSGCVLKTLTIDNFAFPLLSEVSTFREVTGLNVLSTIGVADNTVQRFKKADGYEIIFPNLQHLFLENCRTADGVLADMLWSRREQLRSFRVCFKQDEHRKDLMTMEWLRRDGLKIDVYDLISNCQMFNSKIQHIGFYLQVDHHDGDVTLTTHCPEYEKTWR